MTTTRAFLCYARVDDPEANRPISGLVEDLRTEYLQLTGEQLEVFFDRESLVWGDDWREVIDEAVRTSSFFIPVLSPSFLKSSECRREFLRFSQEATGLGLHDLILSVYWISSRDIDRAADVHEDELLAAVRRYNWEDLREARLEERSSSLYRKAINGLAQALANHADRLEQVELTTDFSEPVATDDSDEEVDGFLDKVAEGEEALPKVTEHIERMGTLSSQLGDVMEKATAEVEAADARGEGTRARLRIAEQMALRMMPISRELEEVGREYLTQLMSTDQGLSAMLDKVSDEELEDTEVQELLHQLVTLRVNFEQGLVGAREMEKTLSQIAGLSRGLRRPARMAQNGIRSFIDGDQFLQGWEERAKTLLLRSNHEPASV